MTRDEGRGAVLSVLQRVAAMALAWLLMGLMLGLLAGRGSGAVGLAAALSAGALVMTPAGLLLAATGGRWDESLAGGMLGMLLGLGVASILGRPDPREAVTLGLVCGALVGATAVTVFYRFPRLVASRLFARPAGLPTAR